MKILRHGGLSVLVLLFVFVFATGGQANGANEKNAQKKPNIIVVMADDLDQRTTDEVPRIQRAVGAQGATFENSFVSNSLCCPSRATFLRGQYTHNHGVLTNFRPTGEFHKFRELGRHNSTIAVWMNRAGYRTGAFGKYVNGYGFFRTKQPGWDRMIFVGENGKYYDVESKTSGQSPNEYADDYITNSAVKFINNNAPSDKPFFTWVTLYSPHAPFEPPKRLEGYRDKYQFREDPAFLEEDVSDKPEWVRNTKTWMLRSGATRDQTAARIEEDQRRRLEMTESLGGSLERIIAALKKNGELKNTYIVFTSDNGYMLGEHHLPLYKSPPYEESIRVPLQIRGPGIVPGTEIEELVVNNDLAPTIARWGGASVPSFVDGRPLTPLFSQANPSWRTALLVEHYEQEMVNNPGLPKIPHYDAIRTKDTTYIEYETNERELYDLNQDPYQLDNALHAPPEETDPEGTVRDIPENAEVEATAARLSERIAALKECKGASCRTAENAR